jgi:FixJ family two-component response regulator
MMDGFVYVVDEDPGVRRDVGRLLKSHGLQAHSCSSAMEFLNQGVPQGPACVVLGLQMPELSGLDLQQLFVQKHATVPIVFIAGHASVRISVQAMKRGAIDFLTKPFDDDQLLTAVDTALTRARQACILRDAQNRDRALFEALSPREQQVCVRVARGMLNKQIAAEFGTAEKTIKVQRGRVMHKLNARSVADVVRLVERLRTAGDLPSHPEIYGN